MNGLFALDLSTGAIEQISPRDLHVLAFDWAADERAVVVAATQDTAGLSTTRSDLFVIDRASRLAHPLVTLPGQDSHPAWSPDGRWIAFASQFGIARTTGPALVPATGVRSRYREAW